MTNRIYREIFASLPCIDGRQEEFSQEQRDKYIKMLYKNTKELINHGVLIPVKPSHQEKEDAKLHGSVTDVQLKFKKNPTPHYVIVGEIVLDDEYYSEYQKGAYPAASVEISESANLMAYTGRETKIGENIYALALCGSTPAAMPQLQEVAKFESQPYALYARVSGPNNYHLQEFQSMTKREMFLKYLMEIFDKMFPSSGSDAEGEEEGMVEKEVVEEMEAKSDKEKVTEAVEEEEGDYACGDKKYEAKEDAKDKIIAELQERIATLEQNDADKEFSALASTGKINAEQKDQFMTIAKTQGLAFARSVYEARPSTVNTDELIGGGEDKNVAREDYKRMSMASGISDAEAEMMCDLKYGRKQ